MIKIPTRVLIVDDEKDFVDMLSLRLEAAGETVHSAGSGEQALARLAEAPIDVVLLDIQMPGLDGIEVLREIRRRHPLVEVILLTGHGTVATAVAAMKLGAYDYLEKPADFKDLSLKLEGARKRREAHEERVRKAEAKLLLCKSGNI